MYSLWSLRFVFHVVVISNTLILRTSVTHVKYLTP
ncbi:hypothetical protein VPHK389_0010 [Vibrio phage K389]